MFLLMEWMDGGSLFYALGNQVTRPLLSRQRISIARDIVDGLNYLHMSGIIHRDTKSLNVSLSKDCRAKLCDRLWSRHAAHHAHNNNCDIVRQASVGNLRMDSARSCIRRREAFGEK